KIDLCQFDIEEQTRIWNALNKPYRLSACYEVRIVSIDSTIRRNRTPGRRDQSAGREGSAGRDRTQAAALGLALRPLPL
ncbi:MAG: Pvc16 family protein, partial [Acidobacteriota bacterium]